MYLVGVDGGGTKTECIITNSKEEIIALGKSGPSSLRGREINDAVLNIATAINNALLKVEKDEIELVSIGLAAFAEEFNEKEEEIRNVLFEKIKNTGIGKDRIFIKSDQEIAFRAGTNNRDGVIAIAGTGSVVRGWNNKNEFKTGGWGWLTDESGGFQIGRRALKITAESFDNRKSSTTLTEMVMQTLDANHINDINKIIYQNNFINIVSPLSIIVDEAAKKGDKGALQIIKDASRSLAFSVKNTVNQLSFQERFPLVLSGSVFKSDLFLTNFQDIIFTFNFNLEIIILDKYPAMGAIILAKEELEK